MAFQIKWTPQAEKGLNKVIEYLEKEWSEREILKLEEKINQVIHQISKNPRLFPSSNTYKSLHKAIIDKNNYLVYKIDTNSNSIQIINFRGTKQKPRY
ncbi:MAG: type II toxin-antitoxin system RelE/ParE family toxin [Flavobacterium sp.]